MCSGESRYDDESLAHVQTLGVKISGLQWNLDTSVIEYRVIWWTEMEQTLNTIQKETNPDNSHPSIKNQGAGRELYTTSKTSRK